MPAPIANYGLGLTPQGRYAPTAPQSPNTARMQPATTPGYGAPAGNQGGGGGFLGAWNPDQVYGPYYDPRPGFERQSVYNNFSGEGYPGSQPGAGAYGLPRSVNGWSPAARFAIPIAGAYEQQLSPVLGFLKNEMGRDIQGELFSRSMGITDTNLAEGRRLSENQFRQSGYRGASQQNPFMALQLQMEGAARGGALGTAARQSMLAAQERKLQIAPTIQQMLASEAQAWMGPAQLQAGSVSRTPVGSVGPSYLPSGINTLASLLQAGA